MELQVNLVASIVETGSTRIYDVFYFILYYSRRWPIVHGCALKTLG